jgi:L-amino acid N-acyltransferase
MIRKATIDDIVFISAIYNEAIAEGGFTGDLTPLTIDNRRAWLADHHGKYVVFVKVLDGEVVGYAALSPYRKGRAAFNNTCEISYYLSSQHRTHGLGKELINHAIKYSEQQGFTTVVAIILASNIRSINILQHFAFSVSGRLPRVAKINGDYIDHVYLCRCSDLHRMH